VVDIIKKEEANEFLSLRDTDLHHRLQPKEHRLKYGSFRLLDLDELDEVVKKVPIFGFNKPNIYSFKDRDIWNRDKPVKEKVISI